MKRHTIAHENIGPAWEFYWTHCGLFLPVPPDELETDESECLNCARVRVAESTQAGTEEKA